MEMPVPGAGGRHRKTVTYGLLPDLPLTPRQALAQDVFDVRGIYRSAGLYGAEVRSSLLQVIKLNKTQWPGVFE